MPGRDTTTSYRIAVGIVRPVITVVTRRDWRGAEHLPPEGGFVVCSNHISHADPFTLAHYLHDNGYPPRFLGKQAVFDIPVAGRLLRGAGQIPVQRESGDASVAYAAAVEAVRASECVVIYPEGTLTRDPGLWPMRGKTGAARIGLATGCPVVPLAQWGPQGLLAPYGKVPCPLPPKRVVVRAGPPVDLSPFAGRRVDLALVAAATDTILDDVTRLLEEIRGEQAPPVRWDPRAHGQSPTGDYRRGLR